MKRFNKNILLYSLFILLSINSFSKEKMLEGFEGKNDFVEGENVKSIEITTENITEGEKGLKIYFDGNKTGQDKMYVKYEKIKKNNWSEYKNIVLDIYNPTEKDLSLGMYLQLGEEWDWNESKAVKIKPGLNKNIKINMKNRNWKNAGSGWSYGVKIDNSDVKGYGILVFGNGEPIDDSFVVIDNIRLESEEISQNIELPATKIDTISVEPKIKHNFIYDFLSNKVSWNGNVKTNSLKDVVKKVENTKSLINSSILESEQAFKNNKSGTGDIAYTEIEGVEGKDIYAIELTNLKTDAEILFEPNRYGDGSTDYSKYDFIVFRYKRKTGSGDMKIKPFMQSNGWSWTDIGAEEVTGTDWVERFVYMSDFNGDPSKLDALGLQITENTGGDDLYVEIVVGSFADGAKVYDEEELTTNYEIDLTTNVEFTENINATILSKVTNSNFYELSKTNIEMLSDKTKTNIFYKSNISGFNDPLKLLDKDKYGIATGINSEILINNIVINVGLSVPNDGYDLEKRPLIYSTQTFSLNKNSTITLSEAYEQYKIEDDNNGVVAATLKQKLPFDIKTNTEFAYSLKKADEENNGKVGIYVDTEKVISTDKNYFKLWGYIQDVGGDMWADYADLAKADKHFIKGVFNPYFKLFSGLLEGGSWTQAYKEKDKEKEYKDIYADLWLKTSVIPYITAMVKPEIKLKDEKIENSDGTYGDYDGWERDYRKIYLEFIPTLGDSFAGTMIEVTLKDNDSMTNPDYDRKTYASRIKYKLSEDINLETEYSLTTKNVEMTNELYNESGELITSKKSKVIENHRNLYMKLNKEFNTGNMSLSYGKSYTDGDNFDTVSNRYNLEFEVKF
jgi:hypothetical protein